MQTDLIDYKEKFEINNIYLKNILKNFKKYELTFYKGLKTDINEYCDYKNSIFNKFKKYLKPKTQKLIKNMKFIDRLLQITPNSPKEIKLENGDLKEVLEIIAFEKNTRIQVEVLNSLLSAYDPQNYIK